VARCGDHRIGAWQLSASAAALSRLSRVQKVGTATGQGRRGKEVRVDMADAETKQSARLDQGHHFGVGRS
jgi:hypothetical protein